jgi:hypothetical protein
VPQTEETRVIQLVKYVAVEDRDERLVICDQFERRQSLQELATLVHTPRSGKALELDHRIPRFGG